MTEERLQKILARAGVASRRGAEQVMAEGRITVNGVTVREMGSKADITRDDVRVDGVRIKAPARPVYLVLNKPKGAVATRHDPQGRATVMDLVPAVVGLFPVGRLDVTTEGLLLLTNDGAWAERVLHPRFGHEREYEVDVEPEPTSEQLAALRRGVPLEEGLGKISGLRVTAPGQLRLVLRTGWKRQVRRMCAAVGLRVTRLRRVRMGPLSLGALPLGKWRELTTREVAALRVAR